MKIIILAILVVLAASQCPGYKTSNACFNMAIGGSLRPAFDGCTSYDDPKTCGMCGTGMKVNTAKTGCDLDVAFYSYTYFPYNDADYKNCVNYNDEYNKNLADLTKLNYTTLSCIDPTTK